MAKLTALKVEKERPGKERRELPDEKLTGLYLVIQPSGTKSWAVRYRSPIDGRPRKHTIGTYPAYDLGKARKAGAAALRAVDEGRDPATEKQDARAQARLSDDGTSDKIEDVFAKFMKKRVKKRTGKALRQSTLDNDQRIYDQRIQPKWRGRRVQDITKRDVNALLDGIVDDAPILANRTLALVRRFFNWCIERDIVGVSPCVGVPAPAPESSRDRTLSDVELKALWNAAEGEGYPFGPMVQELILTGQRVDEVRCLPWAELDLEAKLWELPGERTKNGRPNLVALSDKVVEIFKGLPRIKGKGLVFTTTGETPVSGEARAKQRLEAATKLQEHWTLHDIRRTVASGLQRLGFPIEVVEAVLNHKSGTVRGVAAVYARHDYADEKRKALDAWARHIDTILSGKPGTVVPIKRSA
jgi:integrase